MDAPSAAESAANRISFFIWISFGSHEAADQERSALLRALQVESNGCLDMTISIEAQA
jgi:hypothetical protein